MDGRAFITTLIVGILATLTMDVGGMIGFRLGIAGRGPRRSGPHLIGRWIGYLLRGKLKHADILDTPPLPGEFALGMASHYSIGIVLTLLYGFTLLAVHARPSIAGAITYGAATTVLPWFVMYPSQGMGWLGRDAPSDAHMARTSLFNHFVFGVGLALWTAVLRPL